MPNTFLLRSMRSVLISLVASLFLLTSAQAQHGGGGGGHGGGGHFGGGHSGGGHSSHAHAGAGHTGGHHWGWLRVGAAKRSGRDRVPGYIANESGPAEMLGSGNRLPSTFIRTVPIHSTLSSAGERFSAYHNFHRHPRFFPHGFGRFPGSGCFFNGFNQVCFFEPTLSLLWFSAGLYWSPWDWGSSDDNGDSTGAIDSPDMVTAAATDSKAQESADNGTVPPQPIRGLGLDPRFYLLILTNGAERAVTDYWVSDGYIEYVSRDGSRSHIPVGALDLEETVRNNAARGLRFVLRSAP